MVARPWSRSIGATPGNRAAKRSPAAVEWRTSPGRGSVCSTAIDWPRSGFQAGDEVEEVGPGSEGQVDRAGRGRGLVHGPAQDADHGADEGEVPALAAVAVDLDGPARQRGVDEPGHDGGVGVVGGLERAVDVEEAQGQDREGVGHAVGQGVALGRQLGGGVGAQRPRPGGPRASARRRCRRTPTRTTPRSRGGPGGRAASSTFTVPVTLASWAATGSAMERGTEARAAKWTMRSTSAAAPAMTAGSTIEPSTRSSEARRGCRAGPSTGRRALGRRGRRRAASGTDWPR